MVTLRTFANPTEAAMAKSLLDSHNIFCRLIDEDVNRYGGAPFAMPIRLVVAEDETEEAERILNTKGPELPADFDVGVDPDLPKEPRDMNEQILDEVRGFHRTNQWLVLISIVVLVLAIDLVYETPRHRSPWTAVYGAVRKYDYQRALELAKAIVAEHPNDSYGHEYLGYIYFHMGNLNQAEQEYSRAYDLSPPQGIKQKLEEIRRLRDLQNKSQLPTTPTPSP